jgi:hypothetical protein
MFPKDSAFSEEEMERLRRNVGRLVRPYREAKLVERTTQDTVVIPRGDLEDIIHDLSSLIENLDGLPVPPDDFERVRDRLASYFKG